MKNKVMRSALWRGVLTTGLLAVAGAWAQTANAPTEVVVVKAGDTFSEIAGRFTGDVRKWRSLYDAAGSGLADPNLITPGMRFELVTTATGARQLRLVPGTGARPITAQAPAAAPAAAPAPKVAAAPAPAPAPRVAVAPAPAPVAAPAAPAPAAPAPAAPPAPAQAAVPQENVLTIGVLPNIGAAALLAQYEPMQRYLERLNAPQKVRIVIPANFKTFFDGMMRGDFDVAVAAPHFARVAQLDRGMQPLVAYEPRINALFVTAIDGTVQNANDVREKFVGFANPTSLVAMYGVQWLAQKKMEAGKDYQVKSARTDMGVGRMLLSGEVVAAVMSNGEFRALPAEESARLKVTEVFARIPNFIVLAHPRLERERITRLRSQLKDFLGNAEDGGAFARATGFTNIIDVDDAMLRELDPYTAQTRRAMGMGN